jgi:hypothetical protein
VTEKQVKTNVRPPHIPNVLRLNEAEIKRAISCRPSNSEISSKRQPNAFSSSGEKPIAKPKIKIFSPSNQTKSQATNPTTQQQTPKKRQHWQYLHEKEYLKLQESDG